MSDAGEGAYEGQTVVLALPVIVSVPTWVPGNTLSPLQILSGKNKSQVASSVVAQFCNPSNQETSRPAWTCDLASKRSSQQQISTSTREPGAQISWHLLYHEGQVLSHGGSQTEGAGVEDCWGLLPSGLSQET